MNTFDHSPFQDARSDIDALVMKPVRAWMLTPPARRRSRLYGPLLMIPLDLGAAGFQVTVTQSDHGWYIDLKKQLAPKVKLHLVGQARSYLSALYQLGDNAQAAISRLEQKARKHYESIVEESEVAA